MALSLAQLTRPRSFAQMQQLVLGLLQGLGFPTKTGTGTGDIVLSGQPSAPASLLVQIVSGGEPGAATFYYSVDGGVTDSTIMTVPTSGVVALGSTGVSLAFVPGPGGAGPSYAAGDFWNATLSAPNFTTTSWQDGSVPKTLTNIEAYALADLTQLIAALALGGFVTQQPGVTGASGSWLDLEAQNVYGLTRNAAISTVGNDTLTDAASAGPFTIVPGQLWIVSPGGLRFSNVNGGTLAKGGTLILSWQAEAPGSAYNAAGGGGMSLVTSLPGVTCSTFTLTTQGNDAESDIALSTRCQGRWAELGFGAPAAAFDAWARTASSEVTRTLVHADGTTAGQIDVTLAGANGAVSGGAVTVVTSYLTPRAPLCTILNVANASNSTMAIAGTVFVQAASLSAAQAQGLQNLNTLFQSIAIQGTVYLSAIIEQLMSPAGVRNAAVTLNGGSADVVLGANQVATLDTSGLVFVGV